MTQPAKVKAIAYGLLLMEEVPRNEGKLGRRLSRARESHVSSVFFGMRAHGGKDWRGLEVAVEGVGVNGLTEITEVTIAQPLLIPRHMSNLMEAVCLTDDIRRCCIFFCAASFPLRVITP